MLGEGTRSEETCEAFREGYTFELWLLGDEGVLVLVARGVDGERVGEAMIWATRRCWD